MARAGRAPLANVNGEAAAHGCEAGLVGEIVAKINGEGATKRRLGEKSPYGNAFAGNGARQDLGVAKIFHDTEGAAKRLEERAKLAANAVL